MGYQHTAKIDPLEKSRKQNSFGTCSTLAQLRLDFVFCSSVFFSAFCSALLSSALCCVSPANPSSSSSAFAC